MERDPRAGSAAEGGKPIPPGYYAAEAGIAGMAAFAAVFVAGATDTAEAFTAPLIQFIFVFGAVLTCVVAYRWVIRRRLRRELDEFVTASQTQMNRAKDQFIANVSHGLRTPLTGIVGFAHLLKDHLKDASDREAAEMIIESSADLSRIVDDLLVTARLDAGVLETRREDARILEQLETVLEFTSLFDSEIDIDCQDAAVRVDPELFRHVLRNLLINAHRHGRPPVAVKGQIHAGRYICDVSDGGSGVPAGVRDHLFTRFAYGQDGEITGNLGLGLSVVRELCTQMGIQVSYRRHLSMSHFVLAIPLADTAGAVGAEARTQSVIAKSMTGVKDRVFGIPA